nr:hypothetical protein [Tanacetum cinerariifolium]GEW48942.1 hypothetical protein [Tanacetum cinerariifolium]
MSNGLALGSNRRRKSKTSQLWITAEEIMLCKAWCDVTKNNVTEDAMEMRGFGQSAVYDNVQRMNENESCNLTVTQYGHDFTLDACWRF